MPLHIVTRTRERTDATCVPTTLKVGTAILAGLHQGHTLDRVEQWFPLSRRGGHGTRSLFAFAVVFLLAGRSWGIRAFALELKTALLRLVAPVAGLRALPTASSVSRALGGFTHIAVRTCLDQLLTADVDVQRVLASPHVQHRDAHGRGWHVLDVDPTVEAFRQRGLPGGPELPEPVRLAPGVPGYTGHKRGELRIRHIPIQHAGSGLWLGYRLDAAGGSVLPFLADVVRIGRRAVMSADQAARIVVRADGEFCSVGAMHTVLGEGVAVLTRLSRYALLDRDEVVATVAGATWHPVRSSGGGPARMAADLGLFTLYPRDTVAAAVEGGVEVRVIVTRFARSSPADHGVLRDGYQLELFATTLTADAWPASDVVALILRNVLIGRGVAANPLPSPPTAQLALAVAVGPPQPVMPLTDDAVVSAVPTGPSAGRTLPSQPQAPVSIADEPPGSPARASESELQALIHALRALQRSTHIRNAIQGRRKRAATRTASDSTPTVRAMPTPECPVPAGVLIPGAPLFLPASSRAWARAILRDVTLHVHRRSRRSPSWKPATTRSAASRASPSRSRWCRRICHAGRHGHGFSGTPAAPRR